MQGLFESIHKVEDKYNALQQIRGLLPTEKYKQIKNVILDDLKAVFELQKYKLDYYKEPLDTNK